VLSQLDYCASVVAGAAEPDSLEQLTMGLITVREMDGWPDELPGTIRRVEYELQQQFLPYAAKVRLGIHPRT
jgi:hypothetical protein